MGTTFLARVLLDKRANGKMSRLKEGFDIVKLDVGGTVFHTFRSTLLSLPNTFFTGMIDSETGTKYFIDRDGSKFSAVLNYLRGCGSFDQIDPSEADFYALPPPILKNPLLDLIEEDKKKAKDYLSRYKDDIVSEFAREYKALTQININGNELSLQFQLGDKPLSKWQSGMLYDFPISSNLYWALRAELYTVFLSQGFICILSSKDNASIVITFQWNLMKHEGRI